MQVQFLRYKLPVSGKNVFLLLGLTLCFFIQGIGQKLITPPTTYYYQSKFHKVYGDTDKEEVGYHVREDGSGNFYVLSRVERTAGSLLMDLLLVKYDVDANVIWSRKINNDAAGSTLSTSVSDMEIMSNGDVLISLNLQISPAIARIKGSNGSLVWLKWVSGVTSFPTVRRYVDIEMMAGDDFLIVRSYAAFGNNGENWAGIEVSRLDQNGNVIFTRVLATDASGTDILELRPKDIDQLSDGRLLVAVEQFMSANPNGGHELAYLILNSNGSLVNAFSYDIPNAFTEWFPVGITPITTGVYHLFGNYREINNTDAQIFHLIVRSNGSIFEQGIYCNSVVDGFLANDLDGSSSTSAVAAGRNGLEGMLWRKSILSSPSVSTYAGGESQYFLDVDRADGGRYILAGSIDDGTDEQGLFVKSASSGSSECDLVSNKDWTKCISSGVVYCGLPIGLDQVQNTSSAAPNFGLVIVDHTRPCDTICFEPGEEREIEPDDPKEPQDTVRASRKMGGQGQGTILGEEPVLYPQPARDFSYLRFDQPLEVATTAQLFDLQGRLVKQFNLQEGWQEHRLELNGLDSGSYFLSVVTKDSKTYRLRLNIVN